jgi:exodeoxyribonuclease VII large subunit
MAGGSFWDFQQQNLKPKAKASDAASPVAGEKPLSVSQLTAKIERTLKAGLPASLLVRGEVSNFKLHNSSGHAYFTLKDAGSCIDCVMFRDDAARLKFRPADGLELIATGRVAVYAQKGKYQFYANALTPLGQGALELARQQIQAKLEAEGLFAAGRKRPIPPYPQRIVLVTSTATAAVQDMLKVLGRFEFLHVQVFHVPVQGDGSAEQIAGALKYLNGIGQSIDLILLGRGGGSLEDLWEFNEEIVARAIAASRIPVITGIGHEIDVSIADLVADYHAHTPTEAAQVATANWRTASDLIDGARLRLRHEVRVIIQTARQRVAHIERHEVFRRPLDKVNALRQLIDDRQRALSDAVGRRLRVCGDRVTRLEGRLRERHPRHRVGLGVQRVDALVARLIRAAGLQIERQRRRIDLMSARLHGVNPHEVLKRGYSLTTLKKGGQIVRDAAQVRPGDVLVTRLATGQVESRVEHARQGRLFE